jgi:hypothetical protein
MAKKPTVTTLQSGFNSTETLNANFEALRDGFDNTLSLDGSTPNAMEADLDLNGNNIIGAAGLLINGTDYLSDVEAAKAAALVAQAAAELAETNAETAETNAESSETAAGLSATASATSATASAASAVDATNNGATQVALAAAQVTLAETAKTAAELAETNAETAESNAATSATNAATSATTASTGASTASTKASEAAISATNSATSATESETAKTAAEAAKDAALAALDSFDDRYLGAKASDPTLDNDGNALVAGALYYNTTDDVMKVYEGSSWVAAYASLSGALLATNNLSDLVNATSARTNLGLGTAATTASTDYATAAQGTTADSAVQPNDNPTFAGLTTTANVSFGDSDKALFGAGSDLQIYHDGSNSYIKEAGQGALVLQGTHMYLKSTADEYYLKNTADGSVEVYHNGGTKLATTSTGVDVTGTITSDGLTVDTDTLHVDAANNRVGIGTSSPDARLTVDGQTIIGLNVAGSANLTNLTSGTPPQLIAGWSVPAITWTPDASTEAVFTREGSMAIDILAGASSFSNINFSDTDDEDVGAIQYDHSINAMRFRVNASERMRIDSGGNVGIGGSPAGGIKLDVVGKVNVDERLTVDHSGSGSVWIGDNSSTSTDNRYVALYNDNGLRLQTRTDAGAFVSNDYIVETDASGATGHRWQVANAEKMRLTTNGRLGIGTTNPATPLDVNGTVTATSFAGDGSNLTGIAAGAGGGGNDEIFWENGQNVTSNYTITNGKNAMSAGPITINSGVTVTVGAGETWTVI